MKVQGNGVTLAVTHKAIFPIYKKDVWFRKYAITNIISLKSLIKQYQVTYDSIDKIFVVHNNMHESGLHCYNLTNNTALLRNTISKNKQGFPKREINGTEQAKNLYAKLGYPSVKDFR